MGALTPAGKPRFVHIIELPRLHYLICSRNSQDVSDCRLSLGLARRLLWETCRIIEQADWSCLYVRNEQVLAERQGESAQGIQSKMAAGLISSHQGAASVFLSSEEARKEMSEEFDLEVLQHEGASVKSLMLAWVIPNPPTNETCRQAFPLPNLDLAAFPLFRRLALKRAATYERYFCPEPGCEIDFTRLDALLRHGRNCHSKDGKSDVRGKSVRKKSKDGKKAASKTTSRKKKVEHESEPDEDWKTEVDGDSGEETESDDDGYGAKRVSKR